MPAAASHPLLTRSAGVLLHPTSLPGAFGVGTLGAEAFAFIDALAEAGQRWWQVCPLGPTGYADSPYQCLSAFATNPLLLSPAGLAASGLLTAEEVESARAATQSDRVDFGRVQTVHGALIDRACARFVRDASPSLQGAYREFQRSQQEWLLPWTRYAAIKAMHARAPWFEWPAALRDRDPQELGRVSKELADEIEHHSVSQFLVAQQWRELRRYAAQRGVGIIGDMPIFIAHDSAEVWTRRDLFELDDDGLPTRVAGVPPDYFSRTGQRWGNPLYRWPAHIAEQFGWWKRIFATRFADMDILRVDHFRGFEACWAIPYSHATAEHGTWEPAPGMELFQEVFAALGDLPVIAEDLGVITAEVRALKAHFGFPGMNVLQFAFDRAEGHNNRPHAFDRSSVVYTGTHDNDTVKGWMAAAPSADRDFALEYMGSDGNNVHWDMIRLAYASVSQLAVVPLQDILGLGSEARMNTPGTTGGNWQWRAPASLLDRATTTRLRRFAELYERLPTTTRATPSSARR